MTARCHWCKGRGTEPGRVSSDCSVCDGDGQLRIERPGDYWDEAEFAKPARLAYEDRRRRYRAEDAAQPDRVRSRAHTFKVCKAAWARIIAKRP